MTPKHREQEFLGVRLAIYLCMFAAGLLSTYAESTLVWASLGGAGFWAWSCFLMAGSALCFGGKLVDHWMGELVGLPMLWSALGVYGWIFYTTGSSVANHAALSFLFLALALSLFSRWQMVLRIVAMSKEGEAR